MLKTTLESEIESASYAYSPLKDKWVLSLKYAHHDSPITIESFSKAIIEATIISLDIMTKEQLDDLEAEKGWEVTA